MSISYPMGQVTPFVFICVIFIVASMPHSLRQSVPQDRCVLSVTMLTQFSLSPADGISLFTLIKVHGLSNLSFSVCALM